VSGGGHGRTIITDGANAVEALRVLSADLDAASLAAIRENAAHVVRYSVDPKADPPTEPSDGLLYGLIQSGKTSVMTVAAAMAADNGFECIIILTSDIDILYEQTLERIRKALRGISVLGKKDWMDGARFARQIRTAPFAIVCSKNGNHLTGLYNAFRKAHAKTVSLFLIDDEADQASLNTKESKQTDEVSAINRVITQLRDFFRTNTYLQVTATPQALFLQRPDHRYHPSFTVLTNPGPGYAGGDAFFGSDQLLEYVDLAEVNQLKVSSQPHATGTIPKGLRSALFTFFIAASVQLKARPQEGFAFLCHVSVSNRDHAYIVSLIDRFKEDMIGTLAQKDTKKYASLVSHLSEAHAGLARTMPAIPPLEDVLEAVSFYIRGANIKLINVTSSDEIKLDGAFNLFIGGSKLGRGVTIKNLLVSYYGRNPLRPQADTVLQHARMYGYRERDLAVTRLFLPRVLADHFRSIHQMEAALRDLVRRYPTGNFEGVFIASPLKATRAAVLDPSKIGIYVGGGNYNPIYPLRTKESSANTVWLDQHLAGVSDDAPFQVITLGDMKALLSHCTPDPSHPGIFWNLKKIEAAMDSLESIYCMHDGYLVVRRNRDLTQPRRETRQIISNDEAGLAPRDKPTLFLYRMNRHGGELEVWWPQFRMPDGNFVIAFQMG
jgi:Z1 domain